MNKPPHEQPATLRRRSLFAGAGVVGAAAAASALLPALQKDEPSAPTAKPAPARGGGYSLSDHVQHYYQTTRI